MAALPPTLRLLTSASVASAALGAVGTAPAGGRVESGRAQAPTADHARANPRALERLGIRPSAIRLSSRRLTLKVRVRQRARLRLVVIDGEQRIRWTRNTLPKGPHFYNGLLPYAPTSDRPQLQITGRNLVTRRRGRGRIPIKVIGQRSEAAAADAATS